LRNQVEAHDAIQEKEINIKFYAVKYKKMYSAY